MYGVIWRYLNWALLPFLKFLVHQKVVREIVRIVKENEIGIIHLNDQIMRDIFGVFVAEKTGVSCVSHLRSKRSDGFNRRLARYVNDKVTCFIANSENCKAYWCDLGVDASKTMVVHNAVTPFSANGLDIRQEFSVPAQHKYVLGCVANFTEAKGHRFLLSTFARLAENSDDYFLVLVGHGELLTECQSFVKKQGLTSKVRFVGYDARAKEIIAGLDVLIVPSRNEAFGRAILEAMQVGTPVIATRTGGIPELVHSGHNGILVEYGDTENLIDAIIRLTNEPVLRARCVQNAARTVRDKFSSDRYSQKFQDIYSALLSGQTQPLRVTLSPDSQDMIS